MLFHVGRKKRGFPMINYPIWHFFSYLFPIVLKILTFIRNLTKKFLPPKKHQKTPDLTLSRFWYMLLCIHHNICTHKFSLRCQVVAAMRTTKKLTHGFYLFIISHTCLSLYIPIPTVRSYLERPIPITIHFQILSGQRHQMSHWLRNNHLTPPSRALCIHAYHTMHQIRQAFAHRPIRD